jgi:hypothetical protein
MRARYLKMKSLDYTARVDKVNRLRMEVRRSRMMDKMRETLDWHLDFEDQVRTQNFFEKRERQLAYEADAPARAEREEWERYREAELKSSCRSLHFDDC